MREKKCYRSQSACASSATTLNDNKNKFEKLMFGPKICVQPVEIILDLINFKCVTKLYF